jgi:hypothetical protein
MSTAWPLRVVLPLLVAALLHSGCVPPGGCAAVDNSRSIVAFPPGAGSGPPGTSADLALSTDPVADVLGNASIVVGFIADATCDPPDYIITVEDYVQRFAGTSPYYDGYWHLYHSEANASSEIQKLLSLDGDTVTFSAVLSGPIAYGSGGQQGELSAMTLTGTFSADTANAAMRQLYPRWRGPGDVPAEAAALDIPVQWHVDAVVDGEPVTLDTVIAMKLYREQ